MNANISYRLIAIVFLLSLLSACGGKEQDLIDFERIDALCETDPHRAIQLLDSIPEEFLSERALYRHRLLSIKAKDKAFIKHTSDSLICKVIDYYSSQKGSPLYPEALYYGGRVYSDMGDFSKSREYFESALAMPSVSKNSDLKAKILCQMSQLLLSMKLYDQSIRYAKEALNLDSVSNNLRHVMLDREYIGLAYLYAKEYGLSEINFKAAHNIALELSLPDSTCHNIYLAAIKYHTDKIDSALLLIRQVMHSEDSTTRNTALAYASEIYRSAGIPDTARIYATDLINRKDPANKHIGFNTLLSEEIMDIIPQDSVRHYAKNIVVATSDYLKHHGNKTENQKTNYTHSSTLTQEEQNSKIDYIKYILYLALIAIVIVCGILYKRKIRIKHQQIGLKTLYESEELNSYPIREDCFEESNNFPEQEGIATQNSIEVKDDNVILTLSEVSDLRQKLAESVEKMDAKNGMIDISTDLLQTDLYRQITNIINRNDSIPDKSPIWDELVNTILKISPLFVRNLTMLSGGKLKEDELHVALLAKAGITTSNIAKLVSLDKSTISYKKRIIMTKLFNGEINHNKFYQVLQLL